MKSKLGRAIMAVTVDYIDSSKQSNRDKLERILSELLNLTCYYTAFYAKEFEMDLQQVIELHKEFLDGTEPLDLPKH